MNATTSLPSWLAAFPSEEGLIQISQARRFAHDEGNYDAQYSNDPAELRVGQGLVEVLKREKFDFSEPALEVGCGTGLLSLGLTANSPYPLLILTDPSPSFLEITRRKLKQAGISDEHACYAVLMGEELGRLPAAKLSMIALRSTLHHVLDTDEFIRSAARALVPGGVLVFQEPCMEGYILMGAMIQFLTPLAAAGGVELTAAQRLTVDQFSGSMKLYARRDVDKSAYEDKHLFRVDEIMRVGATCGLDVRFLANTSFEQQTVRPIPPPERFTRFFRNYARYCMSWDETMIGLFDRFLAPYMEVVETSSLGGSGPYLHGVFMCRKGS